MLINGVIFLPKPWLAPVQQKETVTHICVALGVWRNDSLVNYSHIHSAHSCRFALFPVCKDFHSHPLTQPSWFCTTEKESCTKMSHYQQFVVRGFPATLMVPIKNKVLTWKNFSRASLVLQCNEFGKTRNFLLHFFPGDKHCHHYQTSDQLASFIWNWIWFVTHVNTLWLQSTARTSVDSQLSEIRVHISFHCVQHRESRSVDEHCWSIQPVCSSLTLRHFS